MFPISQRRGFSFKDITPILGDPELFALVGDVLAAPFRDAGIEKVVGLDARGFIFGAQVAERLGAGFVPIRKKGKLPFACLSRSYALEYGEAEVEIHTDALQGGQKTLDRRRSPRHRAAPPVRARRSSRSSAEPSSESPSSSSSASSTAAGRSGTRRYSRRSRIDAVGDAVAEKLGYTFRPATFGIAMLTKVEIKNYRSFVDAEAPLAPFTLVIGANGSGKSNFLKLFQGRWLKD